MINPSTGTYGKVVITHLRYFKNRLLNASPSLNEEDVELLLSAVIECIGCDPHEASERLTELAISDNRVNAIGDHFNRAILSIWDELSTVLELLDHETFDWDIENRYVLVLRR